jgi:DNA-binding transcriptional LysR family regulator
LTAPPPTDTAKTLTASEQLEIATLRTVLDEAARAPAPVHLLYQASRSSSPNVRSFIDATKAYLRGNPL